MFCVFSCCNKSRSRRHKKVFLFDLIYCFPTVIIIKGVGFFWFIFYVFLLQKGYEMQDFFFKKKSMFFHCKKDTRCKLFCIPFAMRKHRIFVAIGLGGVFFLMFPCNTKSRR